MNKSIFSYHLPGEEFSPYLPELFQTDDGIKLERVSVDLSPSVGILRVSYQVLTGEDADSNYDDILDAFVLVMIAMKNRPEYDKVLPKDIVDVPYKLLRLGVGTENPRFLIQYQFVIKAQYEDPRPRTIDGFQFSYAGYGCPHGYYNTIEDLIVANMFGHVERKFENC